MPIEFDGIPFPSAEARACFINMDKAAQQKWRDQYAPMKPPVPTDIVIKAAPHIDSPPTQPEQPAPMNVRVESAPTMAENAKPVAGTADLLSMLAPEGPWTVRTISSVEGGPPKLPKDLGYRVGPDNADDHENGLHGWIAAAEAGAHNCYLHAAVGPDGKPKLRREDVIGSRAVWSEVDPDPTRFEGSRADILAAMQAEEPPFSCIIDSGNGYQAYKFIEPYRIDGDADRLAELERRNRAISESLNKRLEGTGLKADTCHSADHLLRLAGTTNFVTKKKLAKGYPPGNRPAHIVAWNPERVYTLEELPSCSGPNEGSGSGSVKADVGAGAKPELAIDWTKVKEHDGWLKSSDDLPADFPTKGKIIVDHFGSLDDLCMTLIDAGLLQKKYKSWSEVTIALAAVFKQYGKHSPEEIAAALMCPLVCNEHVKRQKSGDRERAVKNAFNHSHDKKPKATTTGANDCSDVLDALNAEYFVLTQYEGKCRVAFFEETELKRKVLRLQSFQDFENAHGNKYVRLGIDQDGVPITEPRGKWWLTHKSRREYKSLIFAPHAGKVVDNKLNLWAGYGVQVPDAWPSDKPPPEQCCALYLAHLKNNVCVNADGTPDSVYYEYKLNWMAFSAQFPELPGKVVPVLKGDEGVGKGVAITEWGKLFGSHFLTVTNPKHLVGHFNAHLRDCVALHANEAFYAGDKAHESILKTLVTDDYLMVEPKGRDASLSANHLHMMMSSNEAWVVPMNESARRFWVLHVAKHQQKNTGYFKAIGKQMDEGGREALLYLLLHRDISKFDVEAFPETDAGKEQKEITRGPLADRLAGLTGQERAEVFDKQTGKTIWEERITSNHILYDHLRVQSQAEATFVSRALPKAMQSLGWTGPKKVCLKDAPPVQGYVRPYEAPGGQRDMWQADEPSEAGDDQGRDAAGR